MLRSCWAPPGVRPRVENQQVRKYRDAVLTVAPQEGRIGALMERTHVDHVVMTVAQMAVERIPERLHLPRRRAQPPTDAGRDGKGRCVRFCH